MKNHHTCKTISLGSSDVASLTYRYPNKVGLLNFGEDGHYNAYLADEETEIPSYYSLSVEAKNWIWIYDDYGIVQKFTADVIKVYQAGSFGVIVQLFGEGAVK